MINDFLSGLDAFFANADGENKDGKAVITCNAEYKPIYFMQLLVHSINERIIEGYKTDLDGDKKSDTLFDLSMNDMSSFMEAAANMVAIQSISTSKGVVTITTNVPYETFMDEVMAWNGVIITNAKYEVIPVTAMEAVKGKVSE